ncbi:MAG: hypothetical protein FWE67_04050 [Planctomycetaceae bacterium]|nr:hypothetical protein [Planctomycetaceae bacterium]
MSVITAAIIQRYVSAKPTIQEPKYSKISKIPLELKLSQQFHIRSEVFFHNCYFIALFSKRKRGYSKFVYRLSKLQKFYQLDVPAEEKVLSAIEADGSEAANERSKKWFAEYWKPLCEHMYIDPYARLKFLDSISFFWYFTQ